MKIPFVSLTTLYLLGQRESLNCLCRMSSPIGSLLPLLRRAIIIMHFLVIRVLPEIFLSSMLLLQFWCLKRSRWVCREALYCLVTPGHLLSPHLFLNYRHIIEYLLFFGRTTPNQRAHLSQLWNDTISVRWGPFWRLRSAAKHLGFTFEDPFVFTVHNNAYSVDEDLPSLKHIVRDSYRQFYLARASQRRQDCHGQTAPIDVSLTRTFYLSVNNPLHQSILRHVLIGSLDHAHRLFKSNLSSRPTCPHCQTCDETAEHIFWYCTRWAHVRIQYPILMRLFSLIGTQWPDCFFHCVWIEQNLQYGISLLDNVGLSYSVTTFVHDTHDMYFNILLARHAACSTFHSTHTMPSSSQTPYPTNYPVFSLLLCTAARRCFTYFFIF